MVMVVVEELVAQVVAGALAGVTRAPGADELVVPHFAAQSSHGEAQIS
jgi:hypothetical protein